MTLLQLPGDQLSDALIAQLGADSVREFGVHLPAPAAMADRLYFLLLDPGSETLLASGYLRRITPVRFAGQVYTFLNIGGVIANQKRKGYGKAVMAAIRAYLLAHDQTGLGFCWPHNRGFYEKCGFTVEAGCTNRFVFMDGTERVTAGGQYILYLDSSERFMQKVLSLPDEEVFVPDPDIW